MAQSSRACCLIPAPQLGVERKLAESKLHHVISKDV